MELMEPMVKDLYEAAVAGSVPSLLDLVQKDALILERCTIVTSYAETPLHIAAMLGHHDFCSELVSRYSRLTTEVDYRRSTPLHIASEKGYASIVRVLVAESPEMCLSHDGEGRNPIHIAAMKGRIDVLRVLVDVNPGGGADRVRTCRGRSTTLHLCVNYYQIDALKFLVEVQNDEELLNAKDDNGNSILHLSVDKKQVEMVKYLVLSTPIDVDASNSNGLTASDILALRIEKDSKCMEIAHFLQLTPTQRLQQAQFPPQNENNRAISSANLEENRSESGKQEIVWLEKQQNSIMVVASVIATMAFQAGVNPPAFSKDFPGVADFPGIEKYFMATNTTGFLSSLSVILLLISGLPLRHKAFTWTWMLILWISIAATAYSYGIATLNWVDAPFALIYIIPAWFDLIVSLLLLHMIRFLSHRIRGWPFKRKLFMWIVIIIVGVMAQLRLAPLLFSPISEGYVFPRIAAFWIVLTAFLIVLYAIQFVSIIIGKLKSWFKRFVSSFCSGARGSNNVV